MNLQTLLQEFNPSNFLVCTCLLIFSVLFALRLDATITSSYWIIFTPLWIWKILVILGASIGTIIWCKNPDYRLTDSSYIHFKSMLISLSLQLLLLMFELLVCDKLESGRHEHWTLAFIPLIFISILSIVICIWAFKNDRTFQLEVFCAVNILQFIFIPLKLDHFLSWSWVVVFVPLWIVMCLSIIGVLYAVIFAAILVRTPEVAVDQRKASLHSAISYSLVVVPFLVFLVLLSNKLDSTLQVSIKANDGSPDYFMICIPLYFALIILIFLSFGSKGGNLWWFGMRKDFCTFLLSICPCLREYGNISYNKHCNGYDGNIRNSNINTGLVLSQPKKSIVPHSTISMPD